MVKPIFLLIAISLLHTAGFSQVQSRYLKSADKYFQQKDYYAAAQLYERYLGEDSTQKGRFTPYNVRAAYRKPIHSPSYSRTLFQLAESYRALHDYTTAGKWYKKVMEESAAAFPVSQYWYGVSLRANGKADSAEMYLQKFVQSYQIQDEYLSGAKRELQNIAFGRSHNSDKDIKVNPAASAINAEGTYAPSWMDSSLLVFSSSRTDSSSSGDKTAHHPRLYSSNIQSNSSAGGLTKIELPGMEGMEIAAASFTQNGNTVFFTAWGKNNETAAIYKSNKTGAGWSAPQRLSSVVNMDGVNSKQPLVTADGKHLLFSSDRTGGSGKYDIWFVVLNDSLQPTGSAINAGALINTSENEEAPFYHSPSQTLVFSSNGKVGMGGYDLYTSSGDFSTWSEPQNMGAPVNSVKDDIYFAAKGKDLFSGAMISSDRSTDCCLQLFTVVKPTPVEVPATTYQPPVATDKPKATTPVETKPSEPVVADIPTVYFDFNKSNLNEVAIGALDAFIVRLQEEKTTVYFINGYTDTKGSVKYNLALSEARVAACKRYLLSKGISAKRLIIKPYGKCCPVIDETLADGSDNSEARSKNRRVEFVLSK